MLIVSASTVLPDYQIGRKLFITSSSDLLSVGKRTRLSVRRSFSRSLSHVQRFRISCSNKPECFDSRTNIIPVQGFSNTVIGVLGGGQLGRMLCLAASRMGMKVIILDPDKDCPASSVCYRHVVGSYNDSDTVRDFAQMCTILTLEIEHVHVATLAKLEQEGVDCEPAASTVHIIQDKYLQKVHFSHHGIPLADFMQVDNVETAFKAGELFGYPVMVKSRTLAYDGRGNAVARSKDDIPAAVSALGGYERGLYVEKWAPFAKELAVIVARGRDGSVLCYPVVETLHKASICHIVEAPANVSEMVRALALDIAQRAVTSLKGAGIFSVELFLLCDGQVLLNEVAPRPHNSGHVTIESCYTSQFEQHLRAITGLPLGDPSMKTAAAVMYNVLGEEEEGESEFPVARKLLIRAFQIPGASVHWYGKREMRKGRKMGHITIVGTSMETVQKRLKLMLGTKTSDGCNAGATLVQDHSLYPSWREPFGNGVCSLGATPLVGIIMGSDSDLRVMKRAAEVLKSLDISFEVTIVSAHRTPERMFTFASTAEKRGLEVIIAGAGGAAHLPGMVASLTCLPVVGVPVKGSSLDGIDSLLSILQLQPLMPKCRK